jgi:molybdopterin-binding protein
VLSIRNLKKSYGSRTVLNLETLDFEPGKLYAVTGPNGAGKTTLLMCIAGLLQPDSGIIRLGGADLNAGRHSAIGFVMQRPVLFSGRVLDNIEYGLRCAGINGSSRRASALAMIERLGLNHAIHKSRRQLSGGEIQRVAIARTLVLQPEILLLDEPFTHLDRESAHFLFELFNRLRQTGRNTVIMASHDLEMGAALADEVIALEYGKRVAAHSLNILRGKSVQEGNQYFVVLTDELRVQHMEAVTGEAAFRVDPDVITISRSHQVSTARNQLKGVLTALIAKNGGIRAEVQAGNLFHVHITEQSCRDLGLQIGDEIWISFKASSVKQVLQF